MNKDDIKSRMENLENQIQTQYERIDFSTEEFYMSTKDVKAQIKELQRQLDTIERLDEIFVSLNDTLSDYRMGEHPRADKETIIEIIQVIEEDEDYLDDNRREELADIKEEIGYIKK